MSAWKSLVAVAALSAALAVYVLWPDQPERGSPAVTPESAGSRAGSAPKGEDPAEPANPVALGAAGKSASPAPPPWLNLIARPAGPFAPNSRDTDFVAPMPAGHEPAAMRGTADNLARWLAEPENQQAQAQLVGVDCRQPPCILSLRHDLPADPQFVGRAQAWLSNSVGLGAVHMFTAPLDARQTRQWYYFNPFEEGTPEHHQYASAAIARIDAERRTFNHRDPSEAMTGPLTPPPPRP